MTSTAPRPRRKTPLGFTLSLALALSISIGAAMGCEDAKDVNERLAKASQDEHAEKAEKARRPPRVLKEPGRIKNLYPGVPPSPLIEPFMSRMTRAEAEALFPPDVRVEVDHEKQLEKRGACPGLHNISLEVKHLEHLGRRARMVLDFTDDELMATRFYPPKDFADYKKRVLDQLGIKLKRKPVFVKPATWASLPGYGQPGGIWRDGRLHDRALSIQRACRYQQQQEDIASGKMLLDPETGIPTKW